MVITSRKDFLPMTKIKPFRALIYNQDKIKDICRVTCPPYDVISASRQKYFHELSPYNFLHILLPQDLNAEDKYKRAGDYFRDWQKNHLFIRDENPAVYFYRQQYNLKGEIKTRFGFMALMHLGGRNSGVFGHEHTHLAAKEDRLRLLREVQANLSPIFVVFTDSKRIIPRLRDKYILKEKPFIDLIDEEKTVHQVWRLDSQEVITGIQQGMSRENIFIADGHHRYEVACAYRDEIKAQAGEITGDEGFSYILAYFTNLESRGLSILPIHRLVKPRPDMEKFRDKLRLYFELEGVKDKTRFFFLMNKAGEREHIIGMYENKRYWLLRLRNVKILDRLIADRSREYRLLDVSVLNYIVLQELLGFDLEDRQKITFSPHSEELIKQVDNDPDYIAFFLNPAKVQQVMAIALNGEKMPAKTTYFYPKVLSGLVINKL